jgi:hypothetical protein
MKRAGALAVVLGAICMLGGSLGASAPFSMPWNDIGAGSMALVFAVSVAAFIIGMNALRVGLEVREEREGSVLRLVSACRSIAGLVLATGTVLAMGVARRGAVPAAAVLVASVAMAAGTWGASRAIARRAQPK